VNEADLLETVRQTVAKHTKGRRFADNTPLVSGGLLDSFVLVELILDLESATGVRIPVGDVQPDDFDSVTKIRDTLERFR
jgi:acyl carrier protein